MNIEREYLALRDEAQATRKYVFERTFIITAVTVAVLNFNTLHTLMIPIALLTLYINYWFIVYRIKSHARIVGYTRVFLENENDYFGWETYLEKYRNLSKSEKEYVKKNAVKGKNSFIFGVTLYHLGLMFLIVLFSVIDWANASIAEIKLSSDLKLQPDQLKYVINILFGLSKEIKLYLLPIDLLIFSLMVIYAIKLYWREKIASCIQYEINIATLIKTNSRDGAPDQQDSG